MSGQQLALFDRKWRGRLPHGCQFAYEFLSRQLLLIKLCASFFNPKLNTFLGVGFAIICVPTDFLKNFDTKKFQRTTSQWLSIFTSFTFHKMNLDLSLIWQFFFVRSLFDGKTSHAVNFTSFLLAQITFRFFHNQILCAFWTTKQIMFKFTQEFFISSRRSKIKSLFWIMYYAVISCFSKSVSK